MAAIKAINSKAEVARAQAALSVNICAARGLQDVLRTNLGPKGTMKMLVSGAGDIKLTKDGNVLLHEMQIQHPTASLIAKVATAQDDITGDGTTSNVLTIGELLKQADLYMSEGLHPRIIAEGFEVAKVKALEVLEQVKIKKEMKREILLDVARTSLQTKVHPQLADMLTEAVVDSVLAIRRPGYPIDLFMVEIMEMKHKSETDKVLAQNSGYDLQETLVKVQVEHSESKQPVGIDLNTGEPMVAADAGVWDNYCVKKQLLHSCTAIATNILLVDEIMRAGMSSLKG
ncbi:LOW QUALITY PROTEIN: T-complex protein 1 subunit zeta-2 [Balaenoptera acutorostrata]|uniref:LOW QUALITY PROTEIN: T-complex protein 1 subunit zeta-2 n=1 Tax=Balaenoptera acutorostrata TaxID=9767 RepID=A0ABM3SRN9_BALAC|nr:LOW QUALITY PROTEIN: T-complex protein 1 subunit zeta-2 [Balaenoptera acutorostrata]